jgi:predicted hydrolase (HD superfamily)
MAKHGILATQMLQGKLPEDSLHAIQCHDHRAGYRPTCLLDKALIVVDALVTSLESHLNNIASITDIHKAIEDASNQKPWLKTLIQRCKELDMTREELFQITLNSL